MRETDRQTETERGREREKDRDRQTERGRGEVRRGFIFCHSPSIKDETRASLTFLKC